MAYNIFMGGRGGAPLHQVVRAADPDVVLVNESPKTPFLWKRRSHRLAEQWDMRWVAGGRDAGSNMIVVGRGIRVRSTRSVVLRQPPFRPRRGIATAQFRTEGRLWGVVACHLGLDRERRVDEVERVLELADRVRGPVVLGGDLNEPPGGPAWQRLRQAGFLDFGSNQWPTFPADNPQKRIDALLLRGGATVTHHGDPGLPDELLSEASDHRPVLALIEI